MAGMWTVCRKELSDQLGTRRFFVLFALILLMSTLQAYQAATYEKQRPMDVWFLRETKLGFNVIFWWADSPSSFVNVMILFGSLLGLALGFNSINKERGDGTLSVVLSQPIYRDSVITGKFVAGLITLSTVTLAAVAMTIGVAIPIIGFGPTTENTIAIVVMTMVTIAYLAFWLSLGILLSVVTKKPMTSMLLSIAVWLVCTMVVSIVAEVVVDMILPVEIPTGENPWPELRDRLQERAVLQTDIEKVSPANLYKSGVYSILGVTQAFEAGSVLAPVLTRISLAKSLTWGLPYVVSILAGLVICSIASYVLFLRTEIRPD